MVDLEGNGEDIPLGGTGWKQLPGQLHGNLLIAAKQEGSALGDAVNYRPHKLTPFRPPALPELPEEHSTATLPPSVVMTMLPCRSVR